MSSLTIAEAPPLWRPLRFLLTAPLWGMIAGSWLMAHGEAAMISRWALPTIVLVHLFTLGVLANAMIGSLLQFLPVAAGSAPSIGRSAEWLHALFNAGLLLFVPAMMLAHPLVLAVASLLLSGSLLGFAAAAMIGLIRGSGPRVLRVGIGMAISSLAPTALMGAALVVILLGRLALPIDRVADLHAASGLLGWVLTLMMAVGAVTLPMFQGTRRIPGLAQWCWLAIALAGLLASVVCRWNGGPLAAAIAVSVPVLLFVGASLLLQIRVRHRRNPALTLFWMLGTVAIGGACVVLLSASLPAAPDRAVLIGTLLIGIGLPSMLNGMMLEIVGFLSWIDLRRRCARGIRIPGVDTLLPESDKRWALAAHGVSALALLAAALRPALASAAGALLLVAYGLTLWCLLRCLRRSAVFPRDNRPWR
ncbi:hypothetical protein [Pseudoxanthomonas wuyuanensis]